MKAGITGAALGMQWLFLRKSPEGEKHAVWINFGMAGAFGAASVYNHSIHRPQPLAPPAIPKAAAASFEAPWRPPF